MISATLNKTIRIDQGVKATNSVGTPYLAWQEYITTYANVYVPTKAVRFEDGELFTYTTQFTIRYNEDTKVINNKYRVFYNCTYYKILQVIEIGVKEGIRLITVAFEDE
jgi:head-tail adaptor